MLRREPAHVAVVGGVSRIVAGGDEQSVGVIACRDGWAAGRLLLALSIEDAHSPGAQALARELRGGLDDVSFAEVVHAWVLARIAFVRERGEIFQSGAATINRGAGDCDDHARLAYALGVAGGLRGAIGVLHHGASAPPDKQGPAHAAALFYVDGGWTFAETTVHAGFGENPNDAARRLGLTNERTDIAREVRIMTEQDLPDVPDGFLERNSAAQVSRDAEMLQLLGYLGADAPACQMTDPTFPVFRRALIAFQRDNGLAPDGLVGPVTRRELAAVIRASVRETQRSSLRSSNIGVLGEPIVTVPVASAHVSDDFLRAVIAMNDRFRAQGARTAAEDWLQVWTYESGLSNIQTHAINPRTGKPYRNAGINQMGDDERHACGFTGTLEEWLSMSLVEQLPFVECFYQGKGASQFRNAVAAYVATFAPAHLAHSGEPNFPLYTKQNHPSQYAANRQLDVGGKGYISVDDMRLALERVARDPVFLEARARVRALGASPAEPHGTLKGGLIASLAFVGAGGALALAYAKGWI